MDRGLVDKLVLMILMVVVGEMVSQIAPGQMAY